MISLAIGAVIGGTVVWLVLRQSGWRNVDDHEHRWFSRTAKLCGEIDKLNAEIRRLKLVQQPRLPNGRFKGREK